MKYIQTFKFSLVEVKTQIILKKVIEIFKQSF